MMTIEEYNNEVNDLKQQITNNFNKLLLDLLAATFAKYPLIKDISFNAYTPYFDDGANCVFNVRCDTWEIKINDENLDDTKTLNEEIFDNVSSILQHIDNQLFLAAFGSNVTITIKQDIITAKEYTDHE
jgi:uncharacterized iron-regulated protein